MAVPKLGENKDLRDAYNLGAIAGVETLGNITIQGDENYPVRMLIRSYDGDELFEFWTDTVHEILEEAQENGDTPETNPNLPTLTKAFKDMEHFRYLLGHEPRVPKNIEIPDHINVMLGLENG